jgi:3-phosphoshikimate 1-carboxyvinyltransferase
MREQYVVRRLSRPPDTTVSIPGSKSVTNRALILAALATGQSRLLGALDSQDTRVMVDSLRGLGFEVDSDPARETVRVVGRGGEIPAPAAELFLENSGTSIRFLTALCSLGSGTYRLDGSERMRLRPQADLLQALSECGAAVRSVAGTGYPPIVVEASGLAGGHIHVGADASSQFVSALLMVAPYARTDVTLSIRGTLRPSYVAITTRMMAQWGVVVGEDAAEDGSGNPRYTVRAGDRYRPQPEYRIEPDASSASYFFAAAAVTGGRITVPGLGHSSLQGDVRFATEVLPAMGCTVAENAEGLTVTGPAGGKLKGLSLDMSAISDTSLTLTAIAPFAETPTTISNIGHTRLQECDRIGAACAELRRMGVRVDERADGYTIHPAEAIRPATIQTYRDHRVAMSFALTGLRADGIVIDDPACADKTFPEYWQRLGALV